MSLSMSSSVSAGLHNLAIFKTSLMSLLPDFQMYIASRNRDKMKDDAIAQLSDQVIALTARMQEIERKKHKYFRQVYVLYLYLLNL